MPKYPKSLAIAGAAGIIVAGITAANLFGTSTTIPKGAEATTAEPYKGTVWPTIEGNYNSGVEGHPSD
jgi:hypothetical protein